MKGDEMNRLFEIARELGDIAQERLKLRRSQAENEALMIIREAAIVPEGGWAGSNADTRKAAEKAAKGGDPELLALASVLMDIKNELEQLEVDRDVLIAERDAWQWTIRDAEAMASGCESVFDKMKHHLEYVGSVKPHIGDLELEGLR